MNDDITYLHNKHKLPKERQEALESGFELYFDVIIRGVSSWNPLKTAWGLSGSKTKRQIADCLEENVVIEIRGAYPIGFNYDIDGNKM